MVVLYGTIDLLLRLATVPASKNSQKRSPQLPVRERILRAAFETFMQRGYATSTTLEIATRAQVSKRELYALVGNKQSMLIACISERAKRLTMPAGLPLLHHRDTLEQVLISFGSNLLREVSHPTIIAVFRLAIGEAVPAPAVARTLDSIGRNKARTALRKIMAEAQACGLLAGNPVALAEQFTGLLWGSLLVSLLLGVTRRPGPREIAGRARDAAAAFLQLHPLPTKA